VPLSKKIEKIKNKLIIFVSKKNHEIFEKRISQARKNKKREIYNSVCIFIPKKSENKKSETRKNGTSPEKKE
jgi:uncharacterized protein YpmB